MFDILDVNWKKITCLSVWSNTSISPSFVNGGNLAMCTALFLADTCLQIEVKLSLSSSGLSRWQLTVRLKNLKNLLYL